MASPAPDDVRRTTQDILARSEFHRFHGLWGSAWSVLRDPVGQLLRLFEWIGGHLTSGGAPGVLAWAVLALVVTLLGVVVVRATRATAMERRTEGDGPVVPIAASAADLWRDAAQYEAQGRFAEAVRAAYAAIVASFADRGSVLRRPGKTAREYLAEVSTNDPAHAPAFEEATEQFEWVWYGERSARSEDVARLRGLAAATGGGRTR